MAKTYAQIKKGSNDRETVSTAQQLLNEITGAGLEVDGIFGAKTDQAVRQYQQNNGLQVDGIIGPKTWASLTGDNTDRDASDTLADAVAEARKNYESFSANIPGEFAFDKQALYDMALQAYQNRGEFSYDPNVDTMYHRYKDLYTNAGRRAMEDTMGKAAALTGGYGNSYAQTAGQQAYQNYMQQLDSVIPELYKLALNRHTMQTDEMYKKYAALAQERDRAYAEHQDRLDDYYRRKDDLYGIYEDAMSRQEKAYSRLYQQILQGYTPTAAELRNAGMTRAVANAIAANK